MKITTEIDSQPLSQAFSFSKEKAKALHGLKGILIGIVADQRLNEKELLFLDSWLKSQNFLSDDEAIITILSSVGDILAHGEINPQELLELQSDIEQLISLMPDPELSDAKGIGQKDELLGFLAGVASDGMLNDQEIKALSQWLDRNESIRNSWPASVVVNRLNMVLEDEIITEEEREDLMLTVNQITGHLVDEETIGYGFSTEVWEDIVDRLEVAGSTFCLTGDFVSGDRNVVDTMLHCLDAKTSSSVNNQVDYLVIGTLASRNWLYTSHGRKIEKALHIKRQGGQIKTITERTLLKFTGCA
ncbi:MAG: NAD-dependent DNA ligase [Pseudohongiellaceae bacterium]